MSPRISRRQALKDLGAAGAGIALTGGVIRGQGQAIQIAGKPVEIAVSSVSPITARITVRPLVDGAPAPVPITGALLSESFGSAMSANTTPGGLAFRAGELTVTYEALQPSTISVQHKGQRIQRFIFDATEPGMTFQLPKGPLLGLGEGGVQFDKKGSTDQMRNGQVTSQADKYGLQIHGTRAPIQWLVGTDGWAVFIHQPYGQFDFTRLRADGASAGEAGGEGRFTPAPATPLPIDLFVVASRDPRV